MTWSLLSLQPHLLTLPVSISALATPAILIFFKHTQLLRPLKILYLLLLQPDTNAPDSLHLQLTTLFNIFTHTNTKMQSPSLTSFPAVSFFITFNTTWHYIYLLTIFMPLWNVNSMRARTLSCSLFYPQLLKQSPTRNRLSIDSN